MICMQTNTPLIECDQIIDLIKNSSKEDTDICLLKDIFNHIEINEKDTFKQKSKLHIFLITKNYLESGVFETDLNEALSLNKEIFISLRNIFIIFA